MAGGLQIEKVNILGVDVCSIDMQTALHQIDQWVQNNEKQYVCVTGVHGIIESQRDADLLAIHNKAGMVTPDGMPLVWINKLYGKKHVSRVYGPDLMLAICGVQSSYRHFFYGGNEGVAELLREKMLLQFPHLKVVGTFCPPFRPLTAEEKIHIITTINEANPDIVWVGLSTPKQEKWMAEHLHQLNAKVLIGVGAAFDFHTGTKPQAPKWMQCSGLEWFFRVLTEPKRLWKRYLISNSLFIFFIVLQLTGFKNYKL